MKTLLKIVLVQFALAAAADCGGHPIPVELDGSMGDHVGNAGGDGAAQAGAQCGVFDETTCADRPGCSVQMCPGCDPGGGLGFANCVASGQPPTDCPTACRGSLWKFCDGFRTLANCQAHPQCHPVFTGFNQRACLCSGAGCGGAPSFNHCSPGGDGACSTSLIMVLPSCAVAPVCCGPGYAQSFYAGCYDDCVDVSNCGS